MKKVTPKLVLRRESIRVLATMDLGRVAGGVVGNSENPENTCALVVVVVEPVPGG